MFKKSKSRKSISDDVMNLLREMVVSENRGTPIGPKVLYGPYS